MFLFILTAPKTINRITNLNTSHVLIYPSAEIYQYIIKSDLNTSHVLIYLSDFNSEWVPEEFKYISCSYLSNLKDFSNCNLAI